MELVGNLKCWFRSENSVGENALENSGELEQVLQTLEEGDETGVGAAALVPQHPRQTVRQTAEEKAVRSGQDVGAVRFE